MSIIIWNAKSGDGIGFSGRGPGSGAALSAEPAPARPEPAGIRSRNALARRFLCLPVAAVGLCCLFSGVGAQSVEYLSGKPGQFVLKNNLDRRPGLDYAALLKTATTVTDWFRRNHPMIRSPRGFDADVSLFGNLPQADESAMYGEQFRVGFSFHYFYKEKGAVKTANDWLAHDTEIAFNQPFAGIFGARLGEDRGFEEGDDPGLKQELERAAARVRQYFTIPPVEKTLAPGVTLYANGTVLVSNPGRPLPWTQVSVGEAAKALLDYWKVRSASQAYATRKLIEGLPDEKTKKLFAASQVSVYDSVMADYKNLPPGEMARPAYYDPHHAGPLPINGKGTGALVVKYNPKCWDTTWPRTSVQFVSADYRITPAAELEAFRERNRRLIDYVGLFRNELPAVKMGELVQP